MLPKRVINSNEDTTISQYDRIRYKNGGFNKNPPKKSIEFVRVNSSNLKLGSTRAALFKLATKLPDSYYKHELLRIAHNTPRHHMSYGVFLIRNGVKPNLTPYGLECILSDWFKAVPQPYEWWYQIAIVKDNKKCNYEPLLRIKDK